MNKQILANIKQNIEAGIDNEIDQDTSIPEGIIDLLARLHVEISQFLRKDSEGGK